MGAAGQATARYLDAASIAFDQSTSNIRLGEQAPNTQKNLLIDKLSNTVAALYGARAARIGLAGSSNTLRQVVGHVIPRAAPDKSIILVDPLCHKSVFGGLIESGLDVVFMKRRHLKEFGMHGPIDLADLEQLLKLHRGNIASVIVTHPTYEGFDSDLAQIFSACRNHSALLCVDSAWGCNYGLVEGMPNCPIKFADIVICSPHKKSLGPSQVSITLFRDEAHARLFDEASKIGSATTSPNWNLLLLFERRLNAVSSGAWNSAWQTAIHEANLFRSRVNEISPALQCLAPEDVGSHSGDPTHVYLSTAETTIRATDWANTLAKEYCVDVELAGPNGLLLLFGPGHAGIASDLADIFLKSFEATPSSEAAVWCPLTLDSHDRRGVINPRRAYHADRKSIRLEDTVGYISASLLYIYPPGIPLLSYGETITDAHVSTINHLASEGYGIAGLSPDQMIQVTRAPPANSPAKKITKPSSRSTAMSTEHTEFTYQGYPFGAIPEERAAEVAHLFREVFCNPPYNQFAADQDAPTHAKSFAEYAPEGYVAEETYLPLGVLDRAQLPDASFRWMQPGEFEERFVRKAPELYVSTARKADSSLCAFSIGRILTVRQLFYTEEIRNPIYYSGREYISSLRDAEDYYKRMEQHFGLSPNDQLFFALGYGAHPSIRGKQFVAPLMNALAENVRPEHAKLPALAEIPDDGAGRVFSQAVHEKTVHGLLGTSHAVVFARELKSVMDHYRQGSRHMMSLVKTQARINRSSFNPHPSDHPGAVIKATRAKGEGVFAEQDINPGELIAQFIGDTYTAELESELPAIMIDRCIQIGPTEYVFAEHRLAEKVNHSCDPNCGIRERTKIIAIKPIKKGEEITWDYRMSENSDWVLEKCACGAERCSGRIEGYDSLQTDIRDAYLAKGAISTWLLDRY